MNNVDTASDSSASDDSSSLPPDVPATDVDAHRSYLKTKRIEFMNHILRNLDIVAYQHIIYLYFLEYALPGPALVLA